MANNIYLMEGIIQVKDLTMSERTFVSLIYQLNGFDPQPYKRGYFASYLNLDERSISRIIEKCFELGYINITYVGHNGILIVPTEKTIDLYNASEVF